ncbi:MAG: hypothetical protein K2J77_08960 [Oscillospiraceae bacterium]|nr:hypothetical protein [Oscillospiraceae bacterium]
MEKLQKLKEIEENRRNIPPLDDLPEGEINWDEISEFILVDMNVFGLFWHYLDDETKTAKLSENSLAVLRLICHDMYDFFHDHSVELERFDQWKAMEKYVRKKYGKLSEKALSRLISDYHIKDR